MWPNQPLSHKPSDVCTKKILLPHPLFSLEYDIKATFRLGRAGIGGKAALFLAPLYHHFSGAIRLLAGQF